MNRLCVIDVPGLSLDLAAQISPNSALAKWLDGKWTAAFAPTWPAVTSSVQATITTGAFPAKHGIVANGIPTFRTPADAALVDASSFSDYRREISFWEQSNQFLDAPRFWQDSSGNSRYKTALLFFQHCMPGFSGTPKPAADIVLTPKPEHGPDGKMKSLLWSNPQSLAGELSAELGPFPLMNYWGPMAGIASSQWIASAAAWVWKRHAPQLQFVYVPHLDYDLQRFGPQSAQAIKAAFDVSVALDPLVNAIVESGAGLLLLSEYTMQPVSRCIYPNRLLADWGLLKTRQTPDGARVDYANSAAFAMVDHQIAHVYMRDSRMVEEIQHQFQDISGVGHAWLRNSLGDIGLDHRRAGDIVLASDTDAWFAYPWWRHAADAPSFAKMVDIHRKPGYDPLELFWDRATNGTSQNNELVKGSHGVPTQDAFIAGDIPLVANSVVPAERLAEAMRQHLER